MSDHLINQPIQLGTACAATSVSGQTIIGAVVQVRKDIPYFYKIEWCDGYSAFYSADEVIAYINKAKRCIK